MLIGKDYLINMAEFINRERIDVEKVCEYFKKTLEEGRLQGAEKERIECARREIDAAIYEMMEAMTHLYKAHCYSNGFLAKEESLHNEWIAEILIKYKNG